MYTCVWLQNVSVTFKSPRVLSQVLDLCLADPHGQITEQCGMAVAQPYCTQYVASSIIT